MTNLDGKKIVAKVQKFIDNGEGLKFVKSKEFQEAFAFIRDSETMGVRTGASLEEIHSFASGVYVGLLLAKEEMEEK